MLTIGRRFGQVAPIVTAAEAQEIAAGCGHLPLVVRGWIGFVSVVYRERRVRVLNGVGDAIPIQRQRDTSVQQTLSWSSSLPRACEPLPV